MAASQLQREQQQKEKKQSVRLHDETLQLEDVSSKQASASVSQISSSAPNSAIQGKGNHSHNNRSKAADQMVSSYPTTAAYSYYYPGFNASVGELYNQGYFVDGNGMETQYPIAQLDNGSFVYTMPGMYAGYEPYTQYVPVSTVGADGQYYGQQVYPSSSMVQYPEYSLPSSGDLMQGHYLWGSSLLVGSGAYGNGHVGLLDIPTSTPANSGSPPSKASKLSDPANLALDVDTGNNKKLKAFGKGSSHVLSLQSDLPSQGYYSVAKYPIYNNQSKAGFLYSNSPVSSKANVKGWGGPDKLKTKGKVSTFDDAKLVNGSKDQCNSAHGSGGHNTAEASANDMVGSGIGTDSLIKRDQYNLPEFSTKYDQAFFFVIKSYSEDDIHKSIKYNVWASTPNGNKRLSSAYLEAQEKMAETGVKCPVFLLFSVNASGQFCGVAEMTGPVDFNKSMDFWQQSKWSGSFPVKWHIIKDIPNAQLRHIILQNNENKPVTNSRDTQEVKLHQGNEMLSVFKSYNSATSILDDFDFYENRQKIMQEKRLRQSVNHRDLQLKVDELTTGFQTIDLSNVKKN